jgi:hypothetical protein
MAIKAIFDNEQGKSSLIIGISRGNLDKMIAGYPMKIEVPEDISRGGEIYIFFGEDEQALVDYLKPAITENTTIHSDPRLAHMMPKGKKITQQ